MTLDAGAPRTIAGRQPSSVLPGRGGLGEYEGAVSLRRRLFNVAKAEAVHAASRLREVATGLVDRGSVRDRAADPDAFDERAEYLRLKKEVEAEIEAEIASGGIRVRRREDNPEIRRYYANLELSPGASVDEIRAAYRRMMRRYHPDKHHQDPERARAAHQLAHQLREAYEGLLRHLEA